VLAVQRLDAHAPHQRAHVAPTDGDALQAQEVAQHPATRERVLQVQFVEPAHQGELGLVHRLGVVVHRAPADAQQLGLPLDRQFGITVDHRFALSNPTLVSAPSKKSFSSVSCPILACKALRSTGAASGPTRGAEHARGTLDQLPTPLRDLVGMHVVLLRNLGDGLAIRHGLYRHLGLEHR
jgi:hypothetical protein